MKFVFIAKHRNIWPVAWLCDAMGVSRSGFHAWLNRSPSSQIPASEESQRDRSRPAFLPATTRTLWCPAGLERSAAGGIRVDFHPDRAADALAGPAGAATAPASAEGRRRSPGRNRSVEPSGPAVRGRAAEPEVDRRLHLHLDRREGWLYVSAVIDLFSRRVVGWSMSAGMTAQLVADALLMAVWRRGKPDALLHHSDQGSQYTSEQFQRLMADSGIVCSMSRSGNRLGQRGDGELLLVAEDRAHRAQKLSHQERGQSRCVRLYRAVLQCDPTSFDDRIRQPC